MYSTTNNAKKTIRIINCAQTEWQVIVSQDLYPNLLGLEQQNESGLKSGHAILIDQKVENAQKVAKD